MTTPTNFMQAWAIEEHGGPDKLRIMELPIPEIRGGDVLIRMRGAEVGDWDALVREGGWPMERPFPLILGLGGSGTVAAVGESVKEFYVGDQVYVYNYPLHENGAWAEYMVVPESSVAQAPASLDLTHAGGIPIVALTAHETLYDILSVQPKDVVFITPGAGGVGHLAVQMAAKLGAHVVATANTRNVDFVKQLGAETVLDYTKQNVLEALKFRFPKGVDKVLNGVHGDLANEIQQLVRTGGRMVDMTGSVTEPRGDVFLDNDYVVKADGVRLAKIAKMIDDGDLKIVIQAVYAFEKAPEALAAAGHTRGKIVLNIDTV